jgi:hypothetical protein
MNGFRMNRLSGHQLGQLLEIPSRYELDGFLKHHGVSLEYSIDDFERESATSAASGRSDKKNSQLSVTRDPSDCCR